MPAMGTRGISGRNKGLDLEMKPHTGQWLGRPSGVLEEMTIAFPSEGLAEFLSGVHSWYPRPQANSAVVVRWASN